MLEIGYVKPRLYYYSNATSRGIYIFQNYNRNGRLLDSVRAGLYL